MNMDLNLRSCLSILSNLRISFVNVFWKAVVCEFSYIGYVNRIFITPLNASDSGSSSNRLPVNKACKDNGKAYISKLHFANLSQCTDYLSSDLVGNVQLRQ